MAWYEENEFFGYLATLLKNKERMPTGFVDYENRSEKSWRLFIEGLISEKNNELDHAQKMFKQSILSTGSNDWVYYLSFSRLNRIQKEQARYLEDKPAYEKEVDIFKQKAREYRKRASEGRAKMIKSISQFEPDKSNHDQKIQIYIKLLEQVPENRTIIGRIAFSHVSHNEWQKAIDVIDIYFKNPTRETSLSLSLGLLKGEVLKIMGSRQESMDHLTKLSNDIHNSWYRMIIKHLVLKPDEDRLIKLAGKEPEKLITLHTALGLWAEGDQDYEKAADHYREALSSYLNNWNEYDLALGRIKKIRKAHN